MNFELGAVVLPAVDSVVAELGYRPSTLGLKILGNVIEEGSRRSHIHFPELKLSLWLDHKEIRDLDNYATEAGYDVVLQMATASANDLIKVFLISRLIRTLQATHVLGVDHGNFTDVWEEAATKLAEYYDGPTDIPAMRLSLGLEEFRPEKFESLKQELGNRLLLTRFLPSGMHKMEVTFYLRR